MTVRHYRAAFERLTREALAEWKDTAAAEVTDCLERSMALHGAIGPVDPSMALLG